GPLRRADPPPARRRGGQGRASGGRRGHDALGPPQVEAPAGAEEHERPRAPDHDAPRSGLRRGPEPHVAPGRGALRAEPRRRRAPDDRLRPRALPGALHLSEVAMERLYELLERYNAAAPADAAEAEREIWRAYGTEQTVLVLDMAGFSRVVRRYGIVKYLAMV